MKAIPLGRWRTPGRAAPYADMGQQTMETQLDQTSFEALVASEVDGQIAADDLPALAAQPQRWAATLHHMLEEIEDTLEAVSRSGRYERDQALADLSDERAAVAAALRRVTGEDVDLPDPTTLGDGDDAAMAASGEPEAELVQAPALQASWMADQVVLWAGNPSATSPDRDELAAFIAEAGAGAVDWVPLAKGVAAALGRQAAGRRRARSVPHWAGWWAWAPGSSAAETGAERRAGWARSPPGPPSWWPRAAWCPRLRKATTAGGGKGNRQRTGSYAVAVGAGGRRPPPPARAVGPHAGPGQGPRHGGQGRAPVPGRARSPPSTPCAAPAPAAWSPRPRRRWPAPAATCPRPCWPGWPATPFNAAQRPADRAGRRPAPLGRPGARRRRRRAARRPRRPRAGRRLAADGRGHRRRAPAAPGRPGAGDRVGRQGPAASRPSSAGSSACCRRCSRIGRARAHVVLVGRRGLGAHDHASGPSLAAAGFEVRVPVASARRPSPRLRLEADPSSGPSRGGRPTSCRKVRWSVLFDDVELDAADIARLTAQARPLVQAKGRWVELDHADLEAAAQALAEHERDRPSCRAPPSCATPSAWRRAPWPGPAVVDGSAAGPSTSCRAPPATPPTPLASPRGLRGRAAHATRPRPGAGWPSSTGWGSAAAWPWTWASARRRPCSPTCWPAGARGPVAGHRPARRAGQLGGRGPALHSGAAGARAPRRRPGRGRRASPSVAADADVVLTTYATAVRDVEALAGGRVAPGRARRGPGHQEPAPARRPASCGASRPGRAWR